jgi:hypothetical protein
MTWIEEAQQRAELRIKQASSRKARSGAIHGGIQKERKRIIKLLRDAGYPETTIELIQETK